MDNDDRSPKIQTTPPRPNHLHQPSALLRKYLSVYAEPEATNPALARIDTWQYCLTVPVFDETVETLCRLWKNLDPQTRFLLILVINSPTPNPAWASTLSTTLEAGGTVVPLNQQQKLIRAHHYPDESDAAPPSNTDPAQSTSAQPDILIVDRYSQGHTIRIKQGVGRARKIAADIAAHLISKGCVASPWIFATDADAVLPEDYFDISTNPQDVAITYPFRHEASPRLQHAADIYELSMLYYVAGLKHAESPFAFPTIGSTIACHVEAYAKVRGYPARATGEDFYLLNKLRKIGLVSTITHSPIILEGRESARVPVGTGRAITRIQRQSQPLDDFQVEHPACFEDLRQFLQMLHRVATSRQSPADFADQRLAAYAEKSGLTAGIEQAQAQNPDAEFIKQHILNQFDALRTRQFIHYFRDNEHGSIAIRDIHLAAFVAPGDAASQCDQLMARIVRNITD